ncbi:MULTISPECIES: hypothetical protein [Bartonella]
MKDTFAQVFDEKQIFCINHYLKKEIAQIKKYLL